MREAHPEERATGVEWYASDADGTGGRLRAAADEFRVREIEAVDPEPVDADPGSYPHLVARATLRDRETNAFASELASRMGISRERVSWAGTKDKRAVTTQLFSVRTEADELPSIADTEIEVVGRTGRPVLFGDLAGNEFEVVIRDPDRPEQAERVLSELRAFAGEKGKEEEQSGKDGEADGPVAVPNFFGPQRFGSYRPVTAAVGFAILRGDWEGAVRTYVCRRSEHEPADTRRARAEVDDHWGGDWGALAEVLPGKLRYERALLSGLAEVESGEAGGEGNGDDDARIDAAFRAALDRLPANLRAMFVHAAQSRLFNEIVSRRMGRGLPLGEAVAGDVVCFRARDAPEGLPLPDPDRSQRVTGDRLRSVNRHCARGRAFVTAPLIGTDTEFGGGEPGEIERATLDEHDLTRAAFDLPEPFGSEGTRRAVLVRTDPAVARDPLTVSFRLPKGSYATTLLREVMKTTPRRLA
ncbi:MAG: tRNA pseudouridine(13) synthase TruD [Haloarculaceae archaeon]